MKVNEPPLVEMIAAHGLDLNNPDLFYNGEHEISPLRIAGLTHSLPLVRLLCKLGFGEANMSSAFLSEVIMSNNSELAKMLIQGGANIEANDKNQSSPLYNAIIMRDLNIVRFLLTNRASVEPGFRGFFHFHDKHLSTGL